MRRKLFQSIPATAAVTALFLVSVFFALKAYNGYLFAQEKHEARTIRLRLLRDQEKDVARKKKLLHLARSFMEKTQLLGFEAEKWPAFEVDIERPVFFGEMEQLINQCANAETYYFRPVSLHLKSIWTPDETLRRKEAASGSKRVRPSDGQEGDILLSLKGAFISGYKQ